MREILKQTSKKVTQGLVTAPLSQHSISHTAGDLGSRLITESLSVILTSSETTHRLPLTLLLNTFKTSPSVFAAELLICNSR